VLSGAGLVAIACTFLFFGDTMQTPGRSTLLPVLGTMLLILGGFNQGALLTRALSIRPLTWIGDLSYSIYLWHWPLIVFAKYIFPESSAAVIFSVILTIFISIATFKFIENPIRKTLDINLNKILKLCIYGKTL
jgi:peptidoglycan/LPS O-acetylase OafA/YrhL